MARFWLVLSADGGPAGVILSFFRARKDFLSSKTRFLGDMGIEITYKISIFSILVGNFLLSKSWHTPWGYMV